LALLFLESSSCYTVKIMSFVSRLPDLITPEILHTPLHELALSIKLLQFVAKAMERSSVTKALLILQGTVVTADTTSFGDAG